MQACKICLGRMEKGSKLDSHNLCKVRLKNGRPIPQLNAPIETEEFKLEQARQLGYFTELGARMNRR